MKYLLMLALVLSSCGGLPQGQDGVDGRSPKCSVIKKDDNKTYLRCFNPDGTAAEAEIIAGEDGQDLDLTLVAQCHFKSELYSARYNVVKIGETSKLVSLAVNHLKSPKVFYQGAVLHAEGDEGYDASEIKLSAWSVAMSGEKSASITQVGSESKEMVCK